MLGGIDHTILSDVDEGSIMTSFIYPYHENYTKKKADQEGVYHVLTLMCFSVSGPGRIPSSRPT